MRYSENRQACQDCIELNLDEVPRVHDCDGAYRFKEESRQKGAESHSEEPDMFAEGQHEAITTIKKRRNGSPGASASNGNWNANVTPTPAADKPPLSQRGQARIALSLWSIGDRPGR